MASVQESVVGAPERASSTAVIPRVILAIGLLYVIGYPIYALYLHPLRDYPGPRHSAITRIPYWISCLRGYQVQWMTKQHEKYGPTIRFGPDDLSYTDAQAWRDICIVPKGKKENGKELRFHGQSEEGIRHMVTENDGVRHATVRRVFSPAFSEQSLRKQEPLFQKYADLMVECARKSGAPNLTELFDFTTFDIMAEFTFGESLGLLANNRYSEWVAMVFSAVRILPTMQVIEFYSFTRTLFHLIEPKFVTKMRLDHFNHTKVRVDKRLKEGSDQPDLWNLVEDSGVLTIGEVYANAELFMAAGTETTASLLTGLTFYLLTHPEKIKLLVDEVRGTFRTNEEITFEALSKLEYLNACIREGLRVYPPVPSALPREVAEGGNAIMGKWVPGGTRVSVHPTAAYRSPANFTNPDEFVPERWLGDPKYKDDVRDAHQPFSVGPRNCIGMNMAWHEMRLLLAKLVFNFDVTSDVGPEWRDQLVSVLWHRKPLVCQMKDARTAA
ncbi:cytochrome P450 [Astrocystis sublimbata]|nr:cytochrome P450 [Astrocystis sublimbata]